MADVKMPKSTPCQFDARGWAPCKKPSDNGWCSKHEGLKCTSCGKQAVRSCDAQMGGLACGASLCADCTHSYAGDGGHVTKEVADEQLRKESEERAVRVASRTSPIQRMNEKLGVPATLFELLKGNWQKEYELKMLYFLELSHGLLGFFPAVFSSDGNRIVVTTDLRLLERVWGMLEPRHAKLRKVLAYVNERLNIAYLETELPSDRENREPCKLLTAAEFDGLVKTEEWPFRWAFGLIGGTARPDKEHFLRSLVGQAFEFDRSFTSATMQTTP